jgi:3',5'-cyclic AMP phosphodiesterase CpdA
MMSKETPLVSYQQLNAALSKPESVAKTNAEAVTTDPTQAAAAVVSMNHALALLEQASRDRDDKVMVSVDHRVASLLQTYMGEEAKKAGKIEPIGPDAYGRDRYEAKFDDKDYLAWVGSFFSWWKGIIDHPWLENPQTKRFNNNARLALLGDWGTGMYGAPESARSIEKDPNGYDVRLHLGDVYYSGNKDEVKERFLDIWPKNKTNNEINRACNSNHEMYTGGDAYFDQTLANFNQSASYFALENDHWILAGLDTAYKGKDLHGNQVAWLTELINNAGGRRVVLFSHHQPFSPFDGGNEKVTNKLSELLSTQKIFGWYWGHEHRCVIYEQHPAWKLFGRCVGHGGYAYFRDKLGSAQTVNNGHQDTVWKRLEPKNAAPAGIILDGPNPYLPPHGKAEKYGPHGYMTLKFDDNHLVEIVHAPDGTVLFNQQLV